MPSYFFHVRGESFDVPDLTGRECQGPEAARAEAERLAAELLETALIAGEIPPDATVEVDDESQRPLLTLPINPGGRQ